MSTEALNQRDAQTVPGPSTYQFEVFYDGDCPLCRREIEFLKRKDAKRLIRFSDIEKLDFPNAELSKTYEQLMAEIHGRLPDGTWVQGVEVFRQLYDAIGWQWAVNVTRWPGVRQSLDWVYPIFAKRRLAWTGRCLDSCKVNRG